MSSSSRWPHLGRPPIVEAVISFTVAPECQITVETAKSALAGLAPGYPKAVEMFMQTARIQRSAAGQMEVQSQDPMPIGVRLESEDSKNVIQAQRNALTVSRLDPYQSWEQFISETQLAWSGYKVLCPNDSKIGRIGLRYINRLPIPLQMRDFRDYLTAAPDVPPRLPQVLVHFDSRVVVPIAPIAAFANILQTTLEPVDSIRPVILDCDVFKFAEFGLNSLEPWELVRQMHESALDIFFESITEQMVKICL